MNEMTKIVFEKNTFYIAYSDMYFKIWKIPSRM